MSTSLEIRQDEVGPDTPMLVLLPRSHGRLPTFPSGTLIVRQHTGGVELIRVEGPAAQHVAHGESVAIAGWNLGVPEPPSTEGKTMFVPDVAPAVIEIVDAPPGATSRRECRLPTQSDIEFTIGRDPESAFVLDDPRISRRHCTISYRAESDAHWIANLGKNGTRVGGRLLHGHDHVKLKHGDELVLAPEVLLVYRNPTEALKLGRNQVEAEGSGKGPGTKPAAPDPKPSVPSPAPQPAPPPDPSPKPSPKPPLPSSFYRALALSVGAGLSATALIAAAMRLLLNTESI